VARCFIVKQKPLSLPSTFRAASSEPHPATSAKLECINDQ
jgi:hypothetical protein